MGLDGADARRVTTTLSTTRKAQLERLARREGVKEAWIVRRALEKYLDKVGDGSVVEAEGER
ncbi:MAG TPA: CopG family transcriptional regulator [Sphingomonas sp.]|uniref:ribbon-helix-helix domain-containing protein n=1 Tax=Sphingomonas sp. TaxID=28214 RepID=UPI002CEF3232|nr:CopG family transcriptional regulator [Sphingomonas sp.]HMI20545.1 CopG family transcriptional regulator [Sphingomonas sp.]